MDAETRSTGRTFERVVAVVAVVAVAAWALVFFLARPPADQRASLDTARSSLAALSQKPGPLPTPHAVQAWKDHNQKVLKVRDGVEEALAARDGNLEKSFEEYDVRRQGGARYRVLYAEKTAALHKRAEPVLVLDSNGAPAKAKEVFSFDDWNWDPATPEIRLSLKKFWIQEAAVDALLAVAAREREFHLTPRLVSIRVENPPAELPPGAIHETIRAAAEVLLDPRDVEDFLAGVLGPGKHGLLTRLVRLKVEKTEALKISYEIPGKQGEETKVKPESFLKPVKTVLDFEVVDYVTEAKPAN